MVLNHYCFNTKDFTDDLLCHIFSYCHFHDANHVVTMLQGQQNRLCDKNSDTPQKQVGNDQYQNHQRWEDLHVWREFFLRDGYAPPDNSTCHEVTIGASTNFRKLYKYRHHLLQNFFSIPIDNGATAAVTTTTTTQTNIDNSSGSDKTSSNCEIPIQTIIIEPKLIPVADLLISPSSNDLYFDNRDPDHHPHESGNLRGKLQHFDFQLISDTTGASLLTVDIRDTVDDNISVATLTLFHSAPLLDLLCAKNSTTSTARSHRPYSNSTTLFRHVCGPDNYPRMLPCQQLVSTDGSTYTIIGYLTLDGQCAEFRFWRITYVHDDDRGSTDYSDAARITRHPSTCISVERYGFCRIPTFTTTFFTCSYNYPCVNQYRFRGDDASESVDHPCLFFCDQSATSECWDVAAYRIHPWRDDGNSEIRGQANVGTINTNETAPRIQNADNVHKIWCSVRLHQRVWSPHIAGSAVLSDSSTLLVIIVDNDIQLWNMVTTASSATPDIIYLNALDGVRKMVETYFPPHTILYETFARDPPENNFDFYIIFPYRGKKSLPIDMFGFFTVGLLSQRSDNRFQLYWEFDCVTMSWRISSLILLPIRDVAHTPPQPQFQYEGNKLVVLGKDNIGYVLLIYQMLLVEDSETSHNGDDSLSQQSRVQSRRRRQCQDSGGVYNFPYEANEVNESRTPTPTTVRRQRREVQFKRRIRHASLDFGRGQYVNLQMSCNERFIIVRVSDDPRGPDRIVSFDLDSHKFDE